MFYQYFYHGKVSSHGSYRNFTQAPITGRIKVVWINTLGD